MTMRSILVPAAAGEDITRRLEAASAIANRVGAHVRLLFIAPDPAQRYRSLPAVAVAAGITRAQIEREIEDGKGAARAAFARCCAANGMASDGRSACLDEAYGVWSEQVGEIEPVLSAAGRLSDLIVLDTPKDGSVEADRMLDAAVFSAGRPVLVVRDAPPDDLMRHVVILWNGSLEASCLVGHSLSLLHDAGRVSILMAEDGGGDRAAADLKRYLAGHGVRAHLLPTVVDHPIGEALLLAAMHVEATTIMLGAYTHGRIRQLFLGGVTRHMLAHATVPLLLEH